MGAFNETRSANRSEPIYGTDAAHRYGRVLDLCRAENLELGQLLQLVGSDPILRRRVLLEANSARNALRRSIRSLPHAVVFLGAKGVGGIAEQLIRAGEGSASAATQSRVEPSSVTKGMG